MVGRISNGTLFQNSLKLLKVCEISTKGYQTMDMKFGIKPLKNITLGAAVLNTFDTTYNNHLNFSFTNQADFSRVPITDPGRNITAFLQYQF